MKLNVISEVLSYNLETDLANGSIVALDDNGNVIEAKAAHTQIIDGQLHVTGVQSDTGDTARKVFDSVKRAKGLPTTDSDTPQRKKTAYDTYKDKLSKEYMGNVEELAKSHHTTADSDQPTNSYEGLKADRSDAWKK